ncbi:MAG: benzoate-CoA ligase family protein [Desulfocapsaceae bacterium]|nr:benzoate-CoA ligase family protein [Desulfocapsaceae bacterium]
MHQESAHNNAAWFLLDRNIEEGGAKRPALHSGDKSISYAEVQREVNRLGNALLKQGLGIEDRVFLLSTDIPELVYALLGSMKIGAVPVVANIMLPPKDISYILNDCRARIAVVHEALFPIFSEARKELRHLKTVVVIGQVDGETAYSEFVRSADTELAATAVSPDDSAVWQYSSGTTGAPKGVIQMHHNIERHSLRIAKGIWQATKTDRVLSVAKLFFGYGQGNQIYIPFSVGASTVLLAERPTPDVVAGTITKYRPTIFCGVPTSFHGILHLPNLGKDYDFSSVRFATSAGEALPESIIKAWTETFGHEIVDGLGSTECFHIFISNRQKDITPGSIGRPIDGFEVKLVDEKGLELEDGQLGNLMVRGDSFAAGYWNKCDMTRRTFLGEWVRTGDKAYRDEKGNYWFSGRGDDMIKAGGIWVSPVEVESAVLQHPQVFECCVVGARDKEGLEKPKAYVVLAAGVEGSEGLTREIQAFVKAKIAPYKYPRWIEYVTKLPKTATGKLQRYKLRDKNFVPSNVR